MTSTLFPREMWFWCVI